MKTADNREYVFSMLPITRPSNRATGEMGKESRPSVDYGKTEQEIFTEAAKNIIHERQDLVLWWTERPSHAKGMKNLPSWVPGWTFPLSMFAPQLYLHGLLSQWTFCISNRKPLRVAVGTLQV
jgi:hypothetical protein